MRAVDPIHPDSTDRPAASKAEARAAQWCAARLSSCGFDVSVDEFPARTSIAPWIALDLSLSALAGLLLGLIPLLSFALGSIAIVLYARDTEGRAFVASRRGVGRNVVATTSQVPRVVIVAGLDGPQGWSAWHTRLGHRLRLATTAVHFVLLAIPAIAAGVWIFGSHSTARVEIVGVFLAVVLIAVCVWACMHDMLTSDDENDIAVQVALRAGELRMRDVWIVLTGASGAGNEGIQGLLRDRGESLGAAGMIALTQIGTGEIIAVEQEGVLKARRAFGGLVQAAEDAGAEVSDWKDTPTDGGVALARHFRAMTLLLGPGSKPAPADRMFAVLRSILESFDRTR